MITNHDYKHERCSKSERPPRIQPGLRKEGPVVGNSTVDRFLADPADPGILEPCLDLAIQACPRIEYRY